MYKVKTNSENITNTERFAILGSLLDGDAEDMYHRYLCIQDKTVGLERVWHCLELVYGYRENDPMTEIYECSSCPSVQSSALGLKTLHQDLIFGKVEKSLGQVEKSNNASLDNLALMNNFVKRLPQNFRKQYI